MGRHLSGCCIALIVVLATVFVGAGVGFGIYFGCFHNWGNGNEGEEVEREPATASSTNAERGPPEEGGMRVSSPARLSRARADGKGCEMGPVCGVHGESVYSNTAYHYFKASNAALPDEMGSEEWSDSAWRYEGFDLAQVHTLKDLRDYVHPGICAHRHWPHTTARDPKNSNAKPPCNKKNDDKWAPREKTIFAFDHYNGEHKRVSQVGEDIYGFLETLPDDDSVRVVAVVHSFPHSATCESFPGPDDDDDGSFVPLEKCAKIQRKLDKKGLNATAQDFQQARAECQRHEIDENHALESSGSRGGGRKGRTGCIWREGDGAYWNKDNGKDGISGAVRGNDHGNGAVFSDRYLNDRDLPDTGLGHLPGAFYCVGPHDRLLRDRETRLCACRGGGRGSHDASTPSYDKKVAGKDFSKILRFNMAPEKEDRAVAELLKRDKNVRMVHSWAADWERMGEKERDDWLMMQSYKDMGVNWWQPDETIEFRDYDPCGSGATRPAPRSGNENDRDTGAEVGEQVLRMAGKAEHGSDWVKTVYGFYGPLVEKIVEIDHGGDLSKVTFFGSSEGGSLAFELPLYLSHKKITEKMRALGLKTARELVDQALTTVELRRPFCVAGIWGRSVVARPQSIQGRANQRRMEDVAAVCHDLTKFNTSVNVVDTTQHAGFKEATFHPKIVRHQLQKLAGAGFAHVHAWETVDDHGEVSVWAVPAAHRYMTKKQDEKTCTYHKRAATAKPDAAVVANGASFPYRNKAERAQADATLQQLTNQFRAETENGLCLKAINSWVADGYIGGYDNYGGGFDLDTGLMAKTLYGDALGYDKSHWGRWFNGPVELAFLSKTVRTFLPKSSDFEEKCAGGTKDCPADRYVSEGVQRHIMRDFAHFKRCVYKGNHINVLPSVANDFGLAPLNFDFEKWKKRSKYGKAVGDPYRDRRGEADEGEEDEDDEFDDGEDEDPEHFVSGEDSTSWGTRSHGTSWGKFSDLFVGDAVCQFAEPDAEFVP